MKPAPAPFTLEQLSITLSVDFPGRMLDDAYSEALNRMQTAHENSLRLREELRRVQAHIDAQDADFTHAQNAADMFHAQIEKLESECQCDGSDLCFSCAAFLKATGGMR